MEKKFKKISEICTVVALILNFTFCVSATHVYNTNEDFDANGKEIIEVCDLVEAEYESKDDSFVLELQRILLEIEDLPGSASEPITSGGIYLPIVP